MLSPQTTEIFAVVGLTVLGLALAAYLRSLRRRLPLTLTQSCWYGVNVLVAKLLWRARISGPLPVPPSHGAVIVCNHRSSIDPCFVELATTRPVHWMVAKEYCDHRSFGWFLRMAEVIPTNRGGIDTAATKAAIRCAQNGGIVGVFPEGRINTTGRVLLPGRPGAALIALKGRVPIVPCYVRGSPFSKNLLRPLIMPAKVELKIGRPIDVSEFYGREGEREVLEEITRRVLREMARLAGAPDFQPELAGRFYKPGLDRTLSPPPRATILRKPAGTPGSQTRQLP